MAQKEIWRGQGRVDTGRTPKVGVNPHNALLALDGWRVWVEVEEGRGYEANL